LSTEALKNLLHLHDYKKVDCKNEYVTKKLFAPREVKSFVEGSISFWDIHKVKDTVCYATFLFRL
jgi:hypothetical protein